MDSWPSRLLLATGGAALGGLAGQMVRGSGSTIIGLLIGLVLVTTTLLLMDAARTRRLLDWLSGPLNLSAPRGPGALGELGYRIERAVRAKEGQAASEQQRLAQFLSAIEASPNGVLLVDEHDQIQWFNRTSAEHFGLDLSRDLEQRLTNLVRVPAFVAYMQSGSFEDGVCFRNPRGDATLSILVRPYAGTMKLVMSQDITERERHDAMRRDFVANVSHEIRSPLTVLSGFVESMRTLDLSDMERSRVLELMRQQTVRMENLVRDLLLLAQLEGTARPQPDAWISVSALTKHVQSDAISSDHQQHRLEFNVSEQAEISGVESELFSAVWNLVGNALRYTPQGGYVGVRWSVRSDGSGEFCVRDDGPGIAKEHIPRLTERFYCVDTSRSRESGGTGLGLSIVKHVVQRHGGELHIDSTVGKGSEFRIVLPAHRVRWIEERQSEAA